MTEKATRKKRKLVELKRRISMYFDTQGEFAKEAAFDPCRLSLKLNGKADLKYKDMCRMITVLHIKKEEVADIFFPDRF